MPSSNGSQAIDNLKNDCATSATGCANTKDYVGQTRGFLGGSSVNFLYSGPYFCDTSVQKSGALPCEAGQKPGKVPPDITSASYVDPLYIPTPLFTQPVNDLQCPSGKPCIDHPMTADLSRLAKALAKPASALAKFPLPGHDHIITDRNNDRPEWWPVTVVGVTNPTSFAAIVKAKSYSEVTKLAADPKSGVLLVPTNIYLFFQTVPGTGAATAAYTPTAEGGSGHRRGQYRRQRQPVAARDRLGPAPSRWRGRRAVLPPPHQGAHHGLRTVRILAGDLHHRSPARMLSSQQQYDRSNGSENGARAAIHRPRSASGTPALVACLPRSRVRRDDPGRGPPSTPARTPHDLTLLTRTPP